MDEPQDPIDRPRRNAADLVAGLVFVALGLAVLYGSWTMPRLEERGIHPLTVPGLVPGLLALALLLCGGLLAAGAWRAGNLGPGLAALLALAGGPAARRVAVALGLILAYTLGLVGWLPFWLSTALFVFAFVVSFEVWLTPATPPLGRTLAWAAGVALVTGVTVVLVFERGFLVRLP
jgi:putative tricarboxylic transport membrane protein